MTGRAISAAAVGSSERCRVSRVAPCRPIHILIIPAFAVVLADSTSVLAVLVVSTLLSWLSGDTGSKAFYARVRG